jgi:hypothetical protein
MAGVERRMKMDPDVRKFTDEVAVEVTRARRLHKGMVSLHEAKAVIEEELDEFWELVKVNPKKLDPEHQERRMKELRQELIQTAAMCVRSIMGTCHFEVAAPETTRQRRKGVRG